VCLFIAKLLGEAQIMSEFSGEEKIQHPPEIETLSSHHACHRIFTKMIELLRLLL
jgi:hypothetical protein